MKLSFKGRADVGNQITPRDAQTYFKRASEVEKLGKTLKSKCSEGGIAIARSRLNRAKTRLEAHSKKLVIKSLRPAIDGIGLCQGWNLTLHHMVIYDANQVEFGKKESGRMVAWLSNRDAPTNIKRLENQPFIDISSMQEYHSGLQIHLKGQTFSSLWKQFTDARHAIYAHQTELAQRINVVINSSVRSITEAKGAAKKIDKDGAAVPLTAAERAELAKSIY